MKATTEWFTDDPPRDGTEILGVFQGRAHCVSWRPDDGPRDSWMSWKISGTVITAKGPMQRWAFIHLVAQDEAHPQSVNQGQINDISRAWRELDSTIDRLRKEVDSLKARILALEIRDLASSTEGILNNPIPETKVGDPGTTDDPQLLFCLKCKHTGVFNGDPCKACKHARSLGHRLGRKWEGDVLGSPVPETKVRDPEPLPPRVPGSSSEGCEDCNNMGWERECIQHLNNQKAGEYCPGSNKYRGGE